MMSFWLRGRELEGSPTSGLGDIEMRTELEKNRRTWNGETDGWKECEGIKTRDKDNYFEFIDLKPFSTSKITNNPNTFTVIKSNCIPVGNSSILLFLLTRRINSIQK